MRKMNCLGIVGYLRKQFKYVMNIEWVVQR